ncbi:gamma-glutamyltranspeptidase/glutathione hydrolase [Herbihabitans rhizosphaerae]|uniref:Glutathione hydrolase proenzyme n=1 Tax=Herbihabitans rhizosphaerae TaxID=1872711 RepID=A0A4Q7KEW5_9PSEU|nr:gamma-glutamyltransferase [Herbihabitans rhizosphaerae]RZS32433.1 gamma-glutamyltranspeptidase/glutathione hydrolase [Herbihabitans rhizosphaerae]
MRRRRALAVATAALAGTLVAQPIAVAEPASSLDKRPVAIGVGGAVVSDTVESTKAGLDVLRAGGTAADAAVAVAATLGVTDPFMAGLGGGGYFVHYDARTGRVSTIDGRETTPAAGGERMFLDPATGQPYPFARAVTSGLSVGTPGMLATWERALKRWGTFDLGRTLRPAIEVADRGWPVTEQLREEIEANADRFRQFTSSAELFLPGGAPPAVGSLMRNPDLADTYRKIARDGTRAFYDGAIGADVAAAAQRPPLAPGATIDPPAGLLTADDLAEYRTIDREPTHMRYRGLDVYGMAPSSSGGITVGEALNILETSRLSTMDRTQALHRYLEASKLAFADRNRYIGDPAYVDVPQRTLLSDRFARGRACLIDPATVLTAPAAPGDVRRPDSCEPGRVEASADTAAHTNHFVVSDARGNVVSYTNTIEQVGGSGIVVPQRGFLLNNELTDFNFAPTQGDAPDPNLPAAGKRPRSSMSPTIVLRHGRPFLALGSPGGSTIITTVLQVLLNRIDFGMRLPQAVSSPRASQRNAATTTAEPAFVNSPEGKALAAIGHKYTEQAEIGTTAALEFLGGGLVLAVGEPSRRGGTSAGVVHGW